MRPICVLCLCLSLSPAVSACSLLEGAAPTPPTSAVQKDVIRPGDALRVTVAGQEEWSGVFPVKGDGTILMARLGAVQAAGLSPAGLEGELRRRLAAGPLKDPQVRVERTAGAPPPPLRPSL